MNLPDNETEMEKVAANARGRVLHEVVKLEKAIEIFISIYIGRKGARTLLFKKLLIGINTRTKLNFFFETTLDFKKSDFISKYPDYAKDLNIIIGIRNSLAHDILDVGNDLILNFSYENAFKLVNFKNKTEPIYFTSDKIDETVALIQKYANAITDLYEGLYAQEPPSD